MTDTALVIAPDWGKGGSNNIFAAQIAYYRSRGLAVVLLLIPEFTRPRQLGREYREGSEHTADLIGYVKARYLDASFKYLYSRRIRRNDGRSIFHRNIMMQAVEPEAKIIDYIKNNNVVEICVNYAQYVDYAVALRNDLLSSKTKIAVHTHDIITHHNKYNLQHTAVEGREKEIEWLKQADKLFHVSDDDCNYFKNFLDVAQITTYITLRPETEAISHNFVHTPIKNSVLFIGDNNVSNRPSMDWFIKQVFPFVNGDVKFFFAGAIGDYLYWNHGPLVNNSRNIKILGKVEDIGELYQNCHLVMMPTIIGTGASVKFVEALAMGVPMIVTSSAIRGTPQEVQIAMKPYIADRPIEFARKIGEILNLPVSSLPFRALYTRYFSNKIWFKRLDSLNETDASPQRLVPMDA